MFYYGAGYMSQFLGNLRQQEEQSLPSIAFVGYISKGIKYRFLALSIIGIAMGCFLTIPVQAPSAGVCFGALGFVAMLMLPTCFTYRCYVDKTKIKETYYILCFKISKEVLWRDVKFKNVKRDPKGNAYIIRLYDINKKKLISFDCGFVGFGKILRMVKRISNLKR